MRLSNAFLALVTLASLTPAAFADNAAEKELLGNIARDGIMEVKAGEIAQLKAKDPEVQKFGKHMVLDHGKANEKLQEAAAKDKVTLPSDCSEEQKKKLESLAALSGGAFDKKYMSEMVEGHKKAIEAVSKEADTGTGACKEWAKTTLSVIKEHKVDADKICSEVDGEKK